MTGARPLWLLMLFLAMPHMALATETSVTFAKDNPELEATLALQHQIHVLQDMITREQEANRLLQKGKEIGLAAPTIDKPDQNLCASVPANIPCAQAYPQLYAGFTATPILPEMPSPVQTAAIAATKVKRTSGPVVQEKTPTLYWLDIACLGTECSALIATDPNNPRTHHRVKAGEPFKGFTIQNISARGVTARYEGRDITVTPAPRR